jgi:outer membrane scaffolding protein for murein synthesis (MipA/OmpV family)
MTILRYFAFSFFGRSSYTTNPLRRLPKPVDDDQNSQRICRNSAIPMRCKIIPIKNRRRVALRRATAMRCGVPVALVSCLHAGAAYSQTPSPLQEWQYSGGIVLARLFQPDQAEWREVAGAAAELQPAYDGSKAYRVMGGPVVSVEYRDIAFVSTGEGIGVNILRGAYYRVGVAVAYDLGRIERDDYTNLRGFGNISAAPVTKIFASYVLSKDFPMVVRIDVRELLGGANGAVADFGAYMPLPGSSKQFVMFAGPSVTLATHHFLQSEFGVTPSESLASGHPDFDAHAGLEAAGIGFSSTKFFGDHWLLNLDGAFSKLLGSAGSSPITERSAQHVITLSVNYRW